MEEEKLSFKEKNELKDQDIKKYMNQIRESVESILGEFRDNDSLNYYSLKMAASAALFLDAIWTMQVPEDASDDFINKWSEEVRSAFKQLKRTTDD